MKKFKKWILIIFISFLVTMALTSYIGKFEKQLLMPIRNYIYFGKFKANESSDEIKVTKYKDVEGYNPVHIAQLVREESLNILNGKNITSNKKNDILKVSNWFLQNKVKKKYKDIDYYVWEYGFDYSQYNIKAPWFSGMAQGQIIESLLAAYEITNESKYLEHSRLAANALYVPMRRGGGYT